MQRAAERAEGWRIVHLPVASDAPLEIFTCCNCAGSRLRSEAPELTPEWENLRKFDPSARTLCPFAWDPYNTNGDCLAEK